MPKTSPLGVTWVEDLQDYVYKGTNTRVPFKVIEGYKAHWAKMSRWKTLPYGKRSNGLLAGSLVWHEETKEFKYKPLDNG